jgi:serine-type D-Ala-D-Ala endopeptidase (penicillin-binding protein 7)
MILSNENNCSMARMAVNYFIGQRRIVMPYFLLTLLVFFFPQHVDAGNGPLLKSRHALVLDEKGKVIVSKKADSTSPIASITKLMTAMVVLDAKQNMKQTLTVTKADRDTIKKTGSRLRYGARLTRKEMLKLALCASENRAAHALARNYPGGEKGFVRAMNKKAKALGMKKTRFRGPTGLNPGNISTARDLAVMVKAAMKYPFIRKASTSKKVVVRPFKKGKPMEFKVTNRLLRSNDKNWDIHLSKTGYINEAGRCLVMRAKTAGRMLTIVLLKAKSRLTPYKDSNRIRKWLLGSNSGSVAWHELEE